ncbi:MAG: FtsX-like permease family protein [Kofleriaceae bacterium]|nr:FtsX-like permease family protein [Kofleriaceae bacterium]
MNVLRHTFVFALDKDRYTLGTGSDQDIQLEAQFLSRRHAVIERDDEGITVTDAGAANGIWINANKTSVSHDGYDVGRIIQFDNRDFAEAKAVDGVEHIAGQFMFGGGTNMTRRGGKANAFGMNAVHPDALYLTTHTMDRGRFLNDTDVAERRKAVVVGRPIVDFLFTPDEDPIGQWIEVAGVPFQIVGVFRNEQGAEQERQLYIPVSTAQLSFNGADRLNALQLTAGDADAAEVQRIIDKIVGQLAIRHQFAPGDVQAVRVHNNVENFRRFSMIFFMISVFVVVIGIGTLAAGVVGVSNIMMISVKERTKEIGVRKALGATPPSIIFMIVQEAVALTGVAGLLGLSAGVACLSLLDHLKLTAFIRNPSIDLSTGVIATAFLVFAGALAGYFPARNAARINPIHALRDQ